MSTGLVIVGMLSFLLGLMVGAIMGWNRSMAYWDDRIRNRPESVHLGPYPELGKDPYDSPWPPKERT